VWNVRYAPPAVDRFSYPIAAVPGDTPRTPRGIWLMPGTYQVRLTAGGRISRQAIVVRLDPRVSTSVADLRVQFDLSKNLDDAIGQIALARQDLENRLPGAVGEAADRWRALLAAFDEVSAPLPRLLRTIQGADQRPTVATEQAAVAAVDRVRAVLVDYRDR